jgi:hypothetical protein
MKPFFSFIGMFLFTGSIFLNTQAQGTGYALAGNGKTAPED